MLKRLICVSLGLALIICMALPLSAKAGTKLDEIEEYNITVDMESDGSMDITYHIDWKVLNDTSEGPLKWVKIGIPNQYVDNIKALSSNINDIYYYSDGGDYVRIDLDRSYYAGEIVTLDFSVRQSNMHMVDSDLCYFLFTPGWFDDIDVKSMTILWNGEDVLSSDATDKKGNYCMWTTSLAAGERFDIFVVYSKDAFDPLPSGTDASYSSSGYSSYSSDSGDWGHTLYIIIIVLLFILRIVIRVVRGGGYRGGFGSHGHGGHFGGGGGCACAGCACACACAGGGRAGCSAKNFYGFGMQINRLRNVLK